MSMGSMSDCLARSMAFSAVPPMPMPSMPGGHQPAPMVGTVLSTQSTTESEGLSMANLLLASEPPPLAATVTSTVVPWTSSTVTHGGGVVFGVVALAGGVGLERGAELVVGVEIGAAHAFVDHLLHVRRSSPGAASKRTSMPTLTKALRCRCPGRWGDGPRRTCGC